MNDEWRNNITNSCLEFLLKLDSPSMRPLVSLFIIIHRFLGL